MSWTADGSTPTADSSTYTADGYAPSGYSGPYYKTGVIVETISNSTGLSITVELLRDE